MDEREYFRVLAGWAVIRVRYLKDRGHILWFSAELEALIGDEWAAIIRYDTAHGFVHRDEMLPNGDQIKSPPMRFASYDDALNFAIDDLQFNYQRYIERYKR